MNPNDRRLRWKKKVNGELRCRAIHHRRRWTAATIWTVQECWDWPRKKLAVKLGRTLNAVQSKLWRLKKADYE